MTTSSTLAQQEKIWRFSHYGPDGSMHEEFQTLYHMYTPKEKPCPAQPFKILVVPLSPPPRKPSNDDTYTPSSGMTKPKRSSKPRTGVLNFVHYPYTRPKRERHSFPTFKHTLVTNSPNIEKIDSTLNKNKIVNDKDSLTTRKLESRGEHLERYKSTLYKASISFLCN